MFRKQRYGLFCDYYNFLLNCFLRTYKILSKYAIMGLLKFRFVFIKNSLYDSVFYFFLIIFYINVFLNINFIYCENRDSLNFVGCRPVDPIRGQITKEETQV